MKIDFKKIDFRQGKYWFPLVLFVPLVAIAYFSCEMFKGPTEQTGMVTERLYRHQCPWRGRTGRER